MASSSAKGRAEELAGTVEEGNDDAICKLIKSTIFKSVAWIGIYLIGYYNFSFAWLITPLMLMVLRNRWKKERDFRLSAARQAALTDERTMIESRIKVEDLPSWVFFPDKERAEWVNSILHQLWPNVGHYSRKIIAESVEPAVKMALEGYSLTGFRFDKVVLGQIPPRVTGIKVYDKNVDRNEIIMDVDLVFASDCDIKFSLKGISAKIGEFSLRGMVRIVFKPLVSDVPLVGGIQVYFLTNPEIDFDLGGIANALDAPGLSDIIRKIVLEQIGAFMVLPNKFTLSLAEGVEQKQLKRPDSAGVLRVLLKKAEKLAKQDIGLLGMGKSDPYANLSVGARKLRTQQINNTVNPEWNFVGDFPIEVAQGQQLKLEIFDHDDPGSDEFLGSATISTGLVASKGEISDMWVDLEGAKTGRALLSLYWLEVSDSLEDLSSELVVDGNLAKCLLHVYVDSCKDLMRRGKPPSPLVEMKVGAGPHQSTWQQNDNNSPVFEQGFVFLVNDPRTDYFRLKVVDGTRKSHVLGTLTIPISDLMKRSKMEMMMQPFAFTDGNQGTITLSAQMKVLKKSKVKPTEEQHWAILDTKPEKRDAQSPSLDEVLSSTIDPMVKTAGIDVKAQDLMQQPEMVLRKRNVNSSPCGRVKLTLQYDEREEELDVVVHEACDLPGGELPDPPDPYVKLYLLPQRNKKSKRKSDAKKDTVRPVYEETFRYGDMTVKDVISQQLEVSVVDKKGIFARGSLMGRTALDLSRVLVAPVNGWFHLEEADGDSD